MAAAPFSPEEDAAGNDDDVARRRQEVQSFRDNRSQLFGARRRRGKKSNKNGPSGNTASISTANEAASIQQSLSRTQNLLKNELDRVTGVASAIDDDGKLLQDTMDTHQSMNVAGAKKALTSLERAQQREHMILMASVAFFWLVVLFVMWQRIISKLPLIDTFMVSLAKLLHLH